MNDGFAGTENPFVARHSADGFAELNSRPQPTERGMAPETRQRVEEVRRRLGVDEFGVDLRAVDMEAPRRPGAVTIDAVDETDTGDRVGQDDTDHIDDADSTDVEADFFAAYSEPGIDWHANFSDDETEQYVADFLDGGVADSATGQDSQMTDKVERVHAAGLPLRARDVITRWMALSRVDRMLVREALGLVPRSELRREVNRIAAMAVADARESEVAELDRGAQTRIDELNHQLEAAQRENHRLRREVLDASETAAGHATSAAAFADTGAGSSGVSESGQQDVSNPDTDLEVIATGSPTDGDGSGDEFGVTDDTGESDSVDPEDLDFGDDTPLDGSDDDVDDDEVLSEAFGAEDEAPDDDEDELLAMAEAEKEAAEVPDEDEPA